MGNIMAIDVGIVLVSITIFDKHNKIFPKKIVESGKTRSLLSDQSYFEVEQSFYSSEHGGTFHFAHFNIHYFRDFLESKAFEAIQELVEVDSEINEDLSLVKKLSVLNMVFEAPISPTKRRGSKSKSSETTADEEEKFEDDSSITAEAEGLSVGGGFPSSAQMEKIKRKYVFTATYTSWDFS